MTDTTGVTEIETRAFTILDEDLTHRRWVPVVNALREECPIFRSNAHEDGYYVFTRHKDIMHALRRADLFSSCPITIPPLGNPRPQIPIEIDPPFHRSYRDLVKDYFSRAAQAAREDEYRKAAVRLIERFANAGACDLARDLCLPLPIDSIMRALMVPDSEQGALVKALTAMLHPQTADEQDESQPAQNAVAAVYEELARLVARRREQSGDDLISILVQAEIGGAALTDEEIMDYTILLCGAGFATTATTLSYCFVFLSEQADVRARLVADPSLIPAFIEELLRYETPTKALARTVVVSHEYEGIQFERGDRIQLLYAAGNRDPAAFEQPESFLLPRRPNRHLGFGAGAHTCIGLHMARIEMKVALEEFLARIPEFKVDLDSMVEVTGATYSVQSLPCDW